MLRTLQRKVKQKTTSEIRVSFNATTVESLDTSLTIAGTYKTKISQQKLK